MRLDRERKDALSHEVLNYALDLSDEVLLIRLNKNWRQFACTHASCCMAVTYSDVYFVVLIWGDL